MSSSELPPGSDGTQPPTGGGSADDATLVLTAARRAKAAAQMGATEALLQHRPPPTQTVRVAPGSGSGPASLPESGSGVRSFDESMLLTIGSRVSEFEITGIIGKGGFGVVYAAWDHALEREVAIKEYLPTSLAGRQPDGSVVPLSESHRATFDTGMRSFFNEARLLAQFDHPSLLKVYRFWQERGTTYMVMPLYRGETLRSALNHMGQDVSEAWLLAVMDGVTQALSVMHRANCFHRDIAPDNIMLLEGTGRPVVLDFGAARRVISDATQALTVILKPGYAPIEQYAEVPDMTQGAWTDVYALAAVMHVAVCGRPPPPSVARMLNDRYVPLASSEVVSARYSQRLLKTIDQSLAVRPEGRPQSMAALREALGLAPDGSDVPTQPQPAMAAAALSAKAQPTGSGPAASKKSRVPAIAGAVALLVLVGGGVAWWNWMNRSPDATPVAVTGTTTPTTAATGAATSKPPPTVTPGQPFDLARSVSELATPPVGAFDVAATAKKPNVKISKDKLEFTVRSAKAGFVYVYLRSTDGTLQLMFPNQLDKRNQIKAGETLSLPRPSWPLTAGGPAGSDQFAVVVSESERDFAGTGIQTDGQIFGVFPANVLESLERTRAGNGPHSLLGKVVCASGATCSEAYGASGFTIVEE